MGLGIVIGTQFPSDKAKYGGLEVSEAKRVKALEDENTKLKRLSAEAMLDSAMLKDIATKTHGPPHCKGFVRDDRISLHQPRTMMVSRCGRRLDSALKPLRLPPIVR
jgi:putative transposase